MVLRQTAAILLDAYRELNAKKMFWITLALSLIVAGAIACLGVNDRGVSVLWWTIPAPIINATIVAPAVFYKVIFIAVGFKLWLTWAAAIIALISTASMIPEFVAGGSIELSLSKPIGRVRLFLTKYCSGLLFVSLQVGLFTIASFLVIGIRGGEWVWAIFLSIPIVVLFFSYLFCLCALIGLITRSTIAALFLTVFAWVLIFGVGFAEERLLEFRFNAEETVLVAERDTKDVPGLIERQKAKVEELRTVPPDESDKQRAQREQALATAEASLIGFEKRLELRQTQLNESKDSARLLAQWHAGLFAAKSVLPKTSETMALLERWLLRAGDLDALEGAAQEASANQREEMAKARGRDGRNARERADIEYRAMRRVEAERKSRSVLWVLGTSIVFEAAVLAVACFIFARRDF